MSTPMMQQYDRLKKQYSDCVLLFRLGDFYETFNDDAKTVSKVLGITLTKRGKDENAMPMAGIPYHALSTYLHKLVKAGLKIAIAEQMEEPQAGRIVEREVAKIITSGTIMDEKSLVDSENNYLAAIAKSKTKGGFEWAVSYVDLTTGEFKFKNFYTKSEDEIPTELMSYVKRLLPSEILAPNNLTFVKNLAQMVQPLEPEAFNIKDNYKKLTEHFKTQNLKGFGIEENTTAIAAAGRIINYLQDTQRSTLSHIAKIGKDSGEYMELDDATIRHLELIFPQNNNDFRNTLLGILGNADTAMGKRLIRRWILTPLISKEQIAERLDSIEELFKDNITLSKIKEKLSNIADIERILGRIGTGSANARDLLGLKKSLQETLELTETTSKFQSTLINLSQKISKELKGLKEVIELIENAILEEPPITITEGGMIKPEYDLAIKEIKEAMTSGKDWIKSLQIKEVERTGITSLKVKFNRVFGYYIEISASNLSKVPEDYIRKQTLVNGERFITPELKEWEDKILNAEDKLIKLEYEVFQQIRINIAEKIEVIQSIANDVAVLDVLSNLADIARRNRYVKPEITEEDGTLMIKKGRHPVVEEISTEPFISNDTLLDNKNQELIILTGPNMSGKSTYIRQVALIVIMAQIGSFVPAEEMKWAIIDKVFTRIGASDNLSKGESTFLVEMNETANILNNATNKSLIILDEVGRGTSTYDGVAIAWAVAEYIHEHIQAKTLFATHYHELIQLEEKLGRVKNFNVAVKEENGKVIFMRRIIEGSTDQSYGIHVAQMAGVPMEVIEKAKETLMSLEQENMFEPKRVEKELIEKPKLPTTQLSFGIQTEEHPAIKKLKEMNIEGLTPLEALNKLSELKKDL